MRISDWSSDVCSSDLRTGPAAHGQEPPHRRIAGQGQDDQQVPGQGLHRPGVVRPRPRPGAQGGRGRPGARLPDALRPAREERDARRRHRQGAQGRRRHPPCHRPGQRGRGDQRPHRRNPSRTRPSRWHEPPPRGVHTKHPARDLVPKEGAVDPEDGCRMRHDLIDKSEEHVAAIAKAAKAADGIFLATDPDREGEAISWHIAEILRERGLLDGKTLQRVVFTEITPRAIREAMASPRDIASNLVDAQQARRALDYLVGFNLSPVLWRKVQRGLSAGRVQSPALRMIVEREEEIEAFVAREYWSVEAEGARSEEHTSELQSLMRISYAVFC